MTKTKLADAIFLVRFKTLYGLASTFLRVQEHWESSRFRGRVFSLEQYMDWYASAFGNFTYYQDWSGFNVPSKALEPFYAGTFDPLMEKEKRLLDLFRRERAPFYVLGVTESSPVSDLTHELAHALFFTDPTYRSAVRAAMRGHDTSALERALGKLGYHRHVVRDEVHAYLIVGAGMLDSSAARKLAPLRRELRTIFRRHAAARFGHSRRAPGPTRKRR